MISHHPPLFLFHLPFTLSSISILLSTFYPLSAFPPCFFLSHPPFTPSYATRNDLRHPYPPFILSHFKQSSEKRLMSSKTGSKCKSPILLKSIVYQDIMVWNPGKFHSHKTEVLCLMLNCTLPCTNPLSSWWHVTTHATTKYPYWMIAS